MLVFNGLGCSGLPFPLLLVCEPTSSYKIAFDEVKQFVVAHPQPHFPSTITDLTYKTVKWLLLQIRWYGNLSRDITLLSRRSVAKLSVPVALNLVLRREMSNLSINSSALVLPIPRLPMFHLLPPMVLSSSPRLPPRFIPSRRLARPSLLSTRISEEIGRRRVGKEC